MAEPNTPRPLSDLAWLSLVVTTGLALALVAPEQFRPWITAALFILVLSIKVPVAVRVGRRVFPPLARAFGSLVYPHRHLWFPAIGWASAMYAVYLLGPWPYGHPLTTLAGYIGVICMVFGQAALFYEGRGIHRIIRRAIDEEVRDQRVEVRHEIAKLPPPPRVEHKSVDDEALAAFPKIGRVDVVLYAVSGIVLFAVLLNAWFGGGPTSAR